MTRVTLHLKRWFPHDALWKHKPDESASVIRSCIDQARALGFTAEASLVSCAHMSLLLGIGFEHDDRYREIRGILDQTTVEEVERATTALAAARLLKEFQTEQG